MNINLSVSVGEAVDKYSILCIKKNEIKNEEKLKAIRDEMNVIYPQIRQLISTYDYHYQCLLKINKDIWDLSEKVRDPDLTVDYKNTLFLETFYKNDARFRIKNKFNKLSSSALKEQKSYPGSQIVLFLNHNFRQHNHYIRYVSLCYDTVILNTTNDYYESIKILFENDPHIMINNIMIDTNVNQDIYNINYDEPIPNLLNYYDFSNEPCINYIMGGRLGDFIHTIYVIMIKYEQTGKIGKLYITDQLQYGGDEFSISLNQTFEELYPIISKQHYIKSFEIYNHQSIDINLNDFRKNSNLYGLPWLHLMSNTFNIPMIVKPWITMNVDEKYKDVILIHQSTNSWRRIHHFTPIVENLIDGKKCMFITCNPKEYEQYSLKHKVPLEIKSNLYEMFVAINSCKLFIGNQSSPLTFAMALKIPLIVESAEGHFYNYKYYDNFYYFTPQHYQIENYI